MKCEEAPEEPATVTTEKILKLECNITKDTNYMHTGILDVCAPVAWVFRLQSHFFFCIIGA